MGNFCGDYVKGKLDADRQSAFPENFLKGVRLHRFIDHFTDTDETVKVIVSELRTYYKRTAPVAADIIFDHFLAKNYSKFYAINLRIFVSEFYRTMHNHSNLIPEPMLPLAFALKENDWLYHYKNWKTVERTFNSMSRRYHFLQGIASQGPEHQKRAELETLFFEYYPRLQQASESFLTQLNVKGSA